MKICLVLILVCLCSSVAMEELPLRRSKRTAHFLLHQFADILGYDLIPKAAVVTDIRSRLGLPPLSSLAELQDLMPQSQQTQTPPMNSTTMGTSTTTTRSSSNSTSSQVSTRKPKKLRISATIPSTSEGPMRLPLALNILNRLQPTVPIANPPIPHETTTMGIEIESSNATSEEALSEPSAEAPSVNAGDSSLLNPTRFFDENNFVFNSWDTSDDGFDSKFVFNGWQPPMPDEFNLVEESNEGNEVKFNNPAHMTRSVGPAKLYPKPKPFVQGPVHRRRSATSQFIFNNKGSHYGYVTYH